MAEKQRKLLPETTPGAFTGMRSGSSLSKAGTEHRKDFMVLRRQNLAPVRLSMPHVPLFKALWKIWMKKRLTDDILSTNAHELAEAVGMSYTSVRSALASMTKNGMVREHSSMIGRYRASYGFEPTQTGIELLALAEYLGDGAFVQVGRKASAWRAPGDAEPGNLFDYARLIRGGTIDE